MYKLMHSKNVVLRFIGNAAWFYRASFKFMEGEMPKYLIFFGIVVAVIPFCLQVERERPKQ